MFERPKRGERAVLVQVDQGNEQDSQALEEFRLLAESAGAEPAALATIRRRSPDPRFFAGSGKIEEIKALIAAGDADLVIFNHSLSPSQERNLERELGCRVVDRTGLILDIFAQRARSFEGKLQVELAQLRHLSTRLVRGWTHLERQKGGIGLRGPGETQLETDRRLLGKRIAHLKQRLERVSAQRGQGRKARGKAEVPTISLVGYTNAGKSTLFNRITESGVYAADQLFATLDPTLRRLELPGEGAVVLADTVGFIRKLYDIERDAKKQQLAPAMVYELRQEKAKPILSEFKLWLDKKVNLTPPKGLLGTAVNYTLEQWDKLYRYIEDGRITIDNNLAENAIRPFVVGRKNWLFSGKGEPYIDESG